MNLKNEFISHLQKSFRGFQEKSNNDLNRLISENLLSPFKIRLPKNLLAEAQQTVKTLFAMRESAAYQNFYSPALTELGLSDPGNKSIAMSYDFHVTNDNHLKLIEVNTNAAFLTMGYEMYRLSNVALPIDDFSSDEIRLNIEQELRLQHKAPPANLNIATIDDHPEQQRLFIEFLLYDEYFKSWGWNSDIKDFREIDVNKIDVIYNRHTDFLFSNPECNFLKSSFNQRTVCVSPNPHEYFLLADKQRLIDWHDQRNLVTWGVSRNDQELIRSVVPECLSIDRNTFESLWGQRKKFFFKPKRAFGSKSSYKGASISRKAFDELIDRDFIAQEYVSAPEHLFETPSGPQSFKYDLRCYAYQGHLQLIVARLYQGQVTNLRTPLGGFACVEFF